MSEVFYQQQPTAMWNHARGVWEKPGMVNLLCEHWALFSETWPTSGMTQNGQVYELPMLAHLTTDSESSSSPIPEESKLRTPSVTDSTGGARSEKQASERGQMVKTADQVVQLAYQNGLKVSPAVEASLMPTPKARDSQAEGYEAGLRRSQPQVGTIVKGLVEGDERVLMPTPTTQDSSGKCRDHGGDLLHEFICGCPRSERREPELMPTPTVFHVSMHDEPIETFLAREEKSSTGQLGKSLGVALRMEMMPTPTTRDYKDGQAEHERNGVVQTDTVARAVFNSGEVLLGTPRANAADSSSVQVEAGAPKSRIEDQVLLTNWGKFEPAIRRWETVLGRKAPAPTKPDGKDGAHRLSSSFTEWMMGLPEGWITGHGLSRNDELKMAGNGVCPQQAELALRILLEGVDLQKAT